MDELLILVTIARAIIILVVLLYATAGLITNERIGAEIVILMIIVVFFDFLENLLSPYIAYWVSSVVFVVTLSAFLYYFRKEILKTFREAAGTLNYLGGVIRNVRYNLGNLRK